MAGMTVSPGGRPMNVSPLGPHQFWKTPGIHVPSYIRGVAHALMAKRGMTKSQAIQVAKGEMENWAHGKGHVHPAVRAAAAAALAEWEKDRAVAHSLSTTDQESIDLARGAMPPLPGTDRPRYPINNHADLKKAIKAVGRAKGDHAKVRRHIIARAKAIGGSHLIPDHWTTTGNLK